MKLFFRFSTNNHVHVSEKHSTKTLVLEVHAYALHSALCFPVFFRCPPSSRRLPPIVLPVTTGGPSGSPVHTAFNLQASSLFNGRK